MLGVEPSPASCGSDQLHCGKREAAVESKGGPPIMYGTAELSCIWREQLKPGCWLSFEVFLVFGNHGPVRTPTLCASGIPEGSVVWQGGVLVLKSRRAEEAKTGAVLEGGRKQFDGVKTGMDIVDAFCSRGRGRGSSVGPFTSPC